MPVYKNEERNSWFCKFYYQDWTGKRKQKKKEGFKTKREAKNYEIEFLKKCSSECSMSFASLVELYIQDCENRFKPSTMLSKKNIIYSKILPYFNSISVNEIKPANIRSWQNELLSKKNKNNATYSSTYLKMVNGQFSAILNFGKKYYGLKENAVSMCGSFGKVVSSVNFWTLEEFNAFLHAIEDKPLSKVIFELLFWTGMRSGELLALTLNDFNFKENTVTIDKNFSRINKKDFILPPKTEKSNRVIVLPDFLCNTIKEYINSLYNIEVDERLFPVTRHYLNYEISRGCKNSGIKQIRVHDLRHSHASLLIEQGFQPLVVAERLGHENVQTTLQTYSHLYPDKQKQLANKLDELIQ